MFALACFFLASYLTITQIIRYLENRDASSIAYKQFNLTPIDKYPTFSICLEGPEVYWNQEKLLFNSFGITSAQYVQFLTGQGIRYEYNETIGLYQKESIDISNDPSLISSFESISMLQSDIIVGVDLVAERNYHTVQYEVGKETSNDTQIPFYIGHQTPNEICFTRISSDDEDLTRMYDLISLKRSLLDPGNHLNLKLRIIVHYPDQLLRSFDNPSFQSSLKGYSANKVLELKISHVTILRKRKDSNVPCNDTIKNDDLRLKMEILKRIDCFPVYWMNSIQNYANIRQCRSRTELEKAHFYGQRYKEIMSQYDPSCVGMTKLVTVVKDSDQLKRHFRFKVEYTESFYQEIENVQDFSFEIFWSSVGGFVGICLGYSVLQIPELLASLPGIIRLQYTGIISKYCFNGTLYFNLLSS